MILIISPSKTQDFSTNNCTTYSHTRQIDESKDLVAILKDKSELQIAKLMSLSEKLAKLNFDRFQSFQTPFTLENAKQALLAFKGDVYNGINAPSLSDADLGLCSKQSANAFRALRRGSSVRFDPTLPTGNGHKVG